MKKSWFSCFVVVFSVCTSEVVGMESFFENIVQEGLNTAEREVRNIVVREIEGMFRADSTEVATTCPVASNSVPTTGSNEVMAQLASNQAAIISLLRQQQSSQELMNEMLLFLVAQQQQRQNAVDSSNFSSGVGDISVSCEGTEGFDGDLDRDL